MKKLFALCLLAACELQPAPKQAPPAPAGSAAPVVVTPPAPAGSAAPVVVAPPAPAGSAAPVVVPPRPTVPAVQATAECEKAAIRFTDLFIAAAPEAQRGIFEQDRANTVRRTEVACTQQGWTAAALSCIEQSKTDHDARACLEKFPAPGAAMPGTGSNGKPYHPPRD